MGGAIFGQYLSAFTFSPERGSFGWQKDSTADEAARAISAITNLGNLQ